MFGSLDASARQQCSATIQTSKNPKLCRATALQIQPPTVAYNVQVALCEVSTRVFAMNRLHLPAVIVAFLLLFLGGAVARADEEEKLSDGERARLEKEADALSAELIEQYRTGQ